MKEGPLSEAFFLNLGSSWVLPLLGSNRLRGGGRFNPFRRFYFRGFTPWYIPMQIG